MADKLYLVKIDAFNCYDVYDSAIIQCESRDVLDQLIENNAFSDSLFNDNIDSSRFNFHIASYQKVVSIEYIGDAVLPRKDGKTAMILCSSFNAG